MQQCLYIYNTLQSIFFKYCDGDSNVTTSVVDREVMTVTLGVPNSLIGHCQQKFFLLS